MKIQLLKKLLLTATLLALAFGTTQIQAANAGAGATLPTISPLPFQGLTAVQIEAAIEEYFASIGSLDVQRYVSNFASDGVLEDPVGTPPVQGTQSLTAYFGGIIAPFSEIKPKVQDIIVCGNEAAVNWKLKLTTTTGKHITTDGMGVFRFDQAGKLKTVQEFWDLATFLQQLQG